MPPTPAAVHPTKKAARTRMEWWTVTRNSHVPPAAIPRNAVSGTLTP